MNSGWSRKIGLLLMASVFVGTPALAQEKPSEQKPFVDQKPELAAETPPAAPAAPVKPSVTAKIVPELGLTLTGGNTKTKSINSAVTGNFTAGEATLDTYFKVLYGESRVFTAVPPSSSTSSMETTADKYEMGAKAGYNVHPRFYLFGTIDYLDDKFSGFDWVVTETGGLGVKVIEESKVKLSLEGGPGGRHTRTLFVKGDPLAVPPIPDSPQERDNDFIGRGALNFLWQITDNAKFTQDAVSIFGPKAGGGIRTTANSALAAQIVGSLSLKLGYSIAFVTDPPKIDHDKIATTEAQEAKSVDSTVTASLMYTFNWDNQAGAKWW